MAVCLFVFCLCFVLCTSYFHTSASCVQRPCVVFGSVCFGRASGSTSCGTDCQIHPCFCFHPTISPGCESLYTQMNFCLLWTLLITLHYRCTDTLCSVQHPQPCPCFVTKEWFCFSNRVGLFILGFGSVCISCDL